MTFFFSDFYLLFGFDFLITIIVKRAQAIATNANAIVSSGFESPVCGFLLVVIVTST